MTAVILDGKGLAEHIRTTLREQVSQLTPRLGRAPKLAVVLVGEDPASQVYVRAKTKAAQSCGLEVEDVLLDAAAGDAKLQAALKKLGADPTVDGILLQLPLPKSYDEFAALITIPPALDADGLHPFNQGLLVRGAKTYEPCTPQGVIALIDMANDLLGRSRDLSGLHAVVIGRSVLVGKPVSFLLQARNATVTMCHSRTKDLPGETLRADIVVAAVGQPELVRGDWVREGAIVIDVGINRLATGKLVGDVHFESVKERAAAITPVPGGVGPLTIAMLLKNTVQSAEQKLSGR